MTRVLLFGLLLVALLVACGADFSFLTVGDWGFKNSHEINVGNQMGIVAQQSSARFIISTGDNFYDAGVNSTTDSQWKTKYEEIFKAKSLQVPWYVVLGNHDWEGNTTAQILYSKVDTRWNLPDLYFTVLFQIDPQTTMRILFIDTVQLSTSSGKKQLQWIQTTLNQSTANWVFVVGHFPVYSGGEHGNTAELVKDVLPLLVKYKVDAYICGHDHTLQHLQSGQTNFYVSGNGAKTQGTYSKIPQSLYGTVKNGFMLHTLTTTATTYYGIPEVTRKMVVQVLDEKGALLYSYTQTAIPKPLFWDF